MKSFDDIKDLIETDAWRPVSIGTEAEQTVHRALKYWLTTDPTCHEVRLGGRIADVFLDGRVYEIQTRGFHAIAVKLAALLETYPVTVVFPVVRKKILYAIGPDGRIGRGTVSPRRKRVASILPELAGLKDLVGHPGLDFLAVVFDAAEYRSALAARAGKRSGRVDLYPRGVPEAFRFQRAEDFRALLPTDMPDEFTVKEFAKALRMSARDAAGAAAFLRAAKLIAVAGKAGRAFTYRIVPAAE